MRLDFLAIAGVLLAAVFIGCAGAFLLYVPVLTMLAVATVVLGLGLMFALGLLTGARWRKSSRLSHHLSVR